jgi:hypothetical protein
VKEVCSELEAEGLDTAKLDMRFGIHSGAITAGILRGTKSRFELFGDTINTASRMESTGQAGKIQISDETAELLRIDNKGSWVTKREDKIVAKGKGSLQTWWAEPMDKRISFSDSGVSNTLTAENIKNLVTSDSERYYNTEYQNDGDDLEAGTSNGTKSEVLDGAKESKVVGKNGQKNLSDPLDEFIPRDDEASLDESC